jgi:hypothetical protein
MEVDHKTKEITLEGSEKTMAWSILRATGHEADAELIPTQNTTSLKLDTNASKLLLGCAEKSAEQSMKMAI